MEVCVRDYVIKPGEMDDWIAGWRDGVMPLRRDAGFELLGSWIDRATDRFVWVLGYDGADGFAAADQRYHDDPRRLALDPEPSDHVATTTFTWLETLD